MLNLLDFVMNVLCFTSNIVQIVYSIYMNRVLQEILNKDAWVDLEAALAIFDVVNIYFALLYLLMATSLIKTLVVWMPQTFGIFMAILGQLFTRKGLMVIVVAVTLSALANCFIGVTLGPYFNHFNRANYVNQRSAVMIS